MALYVIHNNSTDPYFNVALDSWLVREAPPENDYVMLWQNRPAVIIGRYQNTYEEVNLDYADEHDIAIVRRMSGGGAVYHDLGNLNYSLVVSTENRPFNDYLSFTRPVIEALAHFGAKAELTGRNDLTLEGQKFSGNAQYRTPARLLHHGTILFDEDLEVVPRILNVRQDKIESKGIKSVRSRVTNVRPYLPAEVTFDEFRSTLLQTIGHHNGGIAGEFVLTPERRQAVEQRVRERFGQWEWNFGQSPPFNYRGRERFSRGELEVRVDVQSGRILAITIYGDFLGDHDIEPLTEALKGVEFQRVPISQALEALPVEQYLGGITREELLKVLLDMTPVQEA
ncbi:lipoate--protein ligase [Sulfobacillus harzensis]|uniref:lipoate--protein ligase n=1 Tax=Sulfobacillus harzensis TaxID=2729629 RepID=A0A7Y0L5C8_9FIRM|nr:lipoate--protein ligase [Sulfobacillus harzensis]